MTSNLTADIISFPRAVVGLAVELPLIFITRFFRAVLPEDGGGGRRRRLFFDAEFILHFILSLKFSTVEVSACE